MTNKVERRSCGAVETRAEDDKDRKIEGYASVFGQEIEVFGLWRERIEPGAFKRALKEKQDVRALIDHDPSKILGRTVAGTLTMIEDEKGLRAVILPPETQLAQDLLVNIRVGNVSQMSFGFIPRKQTWIEEKGKLPLRKIEDVDLFDVSVVTYPAYDSTSAEVKAEARSLLDAYMPHAVPSESLEQLERELQLVERS